VDGSELNKMRVLYALQKTACKECSPSTPVAAANASYDLNLNVEATASTPTLGGMQRAVPVQRVLPVLPHKQC
jgi:hypothetical protein